MIGEVRPQYPTEWGRDPLGRPLPDKESEIHQESHGKIHMDWMMVLHYMTTDCNFLYTALSANSPARHVQT
jgi:hypothetical protein